MNTSYESRQVVKQNSPSGCQTKQSCQVVEQNSPSGCQTKQSCQVVVVVFGFFVLLLLKLEIVVLMLVFFYICMCQMRLWTFPFQIFSTNDTLNSFLDQPPTLPAAMHCPDVRTSTYKEPPMNTGCLWAWCEITLTTQLTNPLTDHSMCRHRL